VFACSWWRAKKKALSELVLSDSSVKEHQKEALFILLIFFKTLHNLFFQIPIFEENVEGW
jgi:hypothetical protein